MTLRLRRSLVTLALAAVCALTSAGQAPRPRPIDPNEPDDITFPNGKSQRDEILKEEHAQSLKDAAQLIELAQQLKQDLEKNDRYVLSLNDLKKTDDIEKLARKIRTRMRHE